MGHSIPLPKARHRPVRPGKTLMRTLVFAFGLAVLAGACGSSTEPASTQPVRLLDADQFNTYLDENPDTVVLNVHIPYAGHIEATDEFVPFDGILDWDGLPENPDTPIAIYCRSGSMSGEAASVLADAGFTDIVDLDGGMNAWTESGRALIDS